LSLPDIATPPPIPRRYRRSWLLLVALFALFAAGSLFVVSSRAHFAASRLQLEERWHALAQAGVPARDFFSLRVRLATIQHAWSGPVPTVWLGSAFTGSDLAALQESTEHIGRRMYRTARRDALAAGLSYAALVKSWDPTEARRARQQVAKASTPRAWERLMAAYDRKRAATERTLRTLAAISGGLDGGEPHDVLARARALRALASSLTPGSEAACAAVSALRAEAAYLKRPPVVEVSQHHALMAVLDAALLSAGANRALPFPPSVVDYLSRRAGTVSLALYDARTHILYEYNPTARFDTASIIKAAIMGALLYRADETHAALSGVETEELRPMIEESDNQDATDLFDDLGGPAGLAPFLRAAGMTATTPAPAWGLSQTTALDQVNLMKLYAYPNAVLDGASIAYADALMENVVAFERWGVSAGLPAGTTVALKNGWLPVPGGWVINSIGHVSGAGEDYVLAMLSDDNPSEAYGIETLSTVSGLIWNALR